jgi:osmoprotectant transport system permease protein
VIVVGGGLSPLFVSTDPHERGSRVVVGAKTFTEQYVLARRIADRLEEAGFDVEVIESLGFENTYALAMPRRRAETAGIRGIDDLRPRAPDLRIGGDYEFFGRPEWRDLRAASRLDFGEIVGLSGALMYSAVVADEVDVIAAFSTDGRIAANDLLVLEDPLRALPPYDAILLLGPRGRDPAIAAALDELIDTIDDDAMRSANMLVDVEGASIDEAARWLRAAAATTAR